jgi:hypothetical protein
MHKGPKQMYSDSCEIRGGYRSQKFPQGDPLGLSEHGGVQGQEAGRQDLDGEGGVQGGGLGLGLGRIAILST